MTSDHAFWQVDVFAQEPFSGNPLAVITGADHLSDAMMARIANWTNLSETTFLLRPTTPEASYRVRIFTPSEELPFAGHPTLGTASVWAALPGNSHEGMIVQECGVGLVRVKVKDDGLAFAAPPRRKSGALSAAEYAQALAALNLTPDKVLDAAWGDNGPGWQVLHLRDQQSVRDICPNWQIIGHAQYGVVGACPEGSEAQFELRAFAGGRQGFEDPVTGSLNAAIAQWLMEKNMAPSRYIACQGSALGRNGRIIVEREGDTIWIGGAVIHNIRGTLSI